MRRGRVKHGVAEKKAENKLAPDNHEHPASSSSKSIPRTRLVLQSPEVQAAQELAVRAETEAARFAAEAAAASEVAEAAARAAATAAIRAAEAAERAVKARANADTTLAAAYDGASFLVDDLDARDALVDQMVSPRSGRRPSGGDEQKEAKEAKDRLRSGPFFNKKEGTSRASAGAGSKKALTKGMKIMGMGMVRKKD